MTIGAGFLYGLGVFSGFVLAGLAFLIYLSLKPVHSETNPDLDAVTARINANAAKVRAGVDKVNAETDTLTGAVNTVAGIESGE